MNPITKIQIVGIVEKIHIEKVCDIFTATLSVATDLPDHKTTPNKYKVVVFQNDRNPDLSIITKGAKVSVTGRLRNNKYTDRDGNERTPIEILANQVTIL